MFSYFMLCFFLPKFTICSGLCAFENNCRLEKNGGIRTRFLGGWKALPWTGDYRCSAKIRVHRGVAGIGDQPQTLTLTGNRWVGRCMPPGTRVLKDGGGAFTPALGGSRAATGATLSAPQRLASNTMRLYCADGTVIGQPRPKV